MAATRKRVAIVTGAGTGIGRAVAIALSEAGWVVALAGRTRARLEEAAAEAPGETLCVACDVRDQDAVRALFEEVEDRYGRLDLLFNNAGLSAPGVALEDLPLEDWRTVVDTNVTGVFLCTQEAFRLMKRQSPRGGRIINNGSISASMPRPNTAAYTAAKHAVAGLTKATSLDGRAFDIACGQIDIGNAATEMMSSIGNTGALQPNGSILVEPTFDPVHVAEAVVYMAGLPLSANVQSMTLLATKMPFVGRG